MKNTKTGGILFFDRINDSNNLRATEWIAAPKPYDEQPLSPRP